MCVLFVIFHFAVSLLSPFPISMIKTAVFKALTKCFIQRFSITMKNTCSYKTVSVQGETSGRARGKGPRKRSGKGSVGVWEKGPGGLGEGSGKGSRAQGPVGEIQRKGPWAGGGSEGVKGSSSPHEQVLVLPSMLCVRSCLTRKRRSSACHRTIGTDGNTAPRCEFYAPGNRHHFTQGEK